MSKKILIVDVVLLMALILGGMKFRSAWRAFGPAHDVASIQPSPQTFPALLASVGASAQAADWTEIPTHNLFSFDRTDIDIAPVVEAEPPKPIGPKPLLFGTMLLGAKKYAQVAPGPTGKNYKSMEIGQVIDGWTITEIDAKSIIVESNGTRQAVVINDPLAHIAREGGKTAVASAPAVIQVAQPGRAAVTNTSTSSVSSATGPPPNPAALPPPPPGTVRIQTLFGTTTIPEGAQK